MGPTRCPIIGLLSSRGTLMPNQLSIPFKKTYVVQLRQAVRNYILEKHPNAHPDAFRWDINCWEALRKDGVGGVVHVDRVQTSLRYVSCEGLFVQSLIISKIPRSARVYSYETAC